MFFSSQRLPVSWLGVFVALAGTAFCVMQVAPLDLDIPCPSTGCTLFQDFSVHGVSLWWGGVAYFAVMAVLCLRKARALALGLATLALVADGILLAIMLATAACVTCLGAALLIGLLFLVLRRHGQNPQASPPRISVVFLIWSGLFVAASASAASELAGTWRISGQATAERQVYFSPSCPACRDAVAVFDGKAAFVPVAEKDSDYDEIYRMRLALAEGKTMSQALAAARTDTRTEPWSLSTLVHRFRLLRNKAEVLRQGVGQLPLIMIHGMPQSLRPTGAGNAALGRDSDQASANLPPELSGLDFCGENTPQPCDTP